MADNDDRRDVRARRGVCVCVVGGRGGGAGVSIVHPHIVPGSPTGATQERSARAQIRDCMRCFLR